MYLGLSLRGTFPRHYAKGVQIVFKVSLHRRRNGGVRSSLGTLPPPERTWKSLTIVYDAIALGAGALCDASASRYG